MTLHPRILIASVALTLLVGGCSDRGADTAKTVRPSAGEPSSTPTDKWLGQGTGPEGTFLRLAGGAGNYEITIQNLDGPRFFMCTAIDGEIRFERDGVKESIHATNGVDTGMKWLREKTNCLTVRSGEGYCR